MLAALSRCGIEAGAWGIVKISKTNTVKSLFGVEHSREIPHGDYLYIRSDKISDIVFGYLENAVYDIIMTDERDMEHEEEGVPLCTCYSTSNLNPLLLTH